MTPPTTQTRQGPSQGQDGATEHDLTYSEVFGPTLQGEGPWAGRPAAFIRLGMCNLTCTWCDTPYTWDAHRYDLSAELVQRRTDTVVQQVTDMGVGIVVITGGEPLIQQGKAAWKNLLMQLRGAGHLIHVETNGTITPNDTTRALVDQFVVSPKLANSGVVLGKRIKGAALRTLRDHGADFKFVCATPADLDEVEAIVENVGINPANVWIMPEGREPVDHLNAMIDLADDVVARRWNLTPRLHLLCWGSERER